MAGKIPEKVMPGAEPFRLETKADTDKGVLLIHGLTGTPSEMRYLGEYLNRAGYSVYAPLLPGHGTNIKDLNETRWEEIFDAVKEDFRSFGSHFKDFFVAGLSMGGLMTLHLIAKQKRGIKAAAALSTPMAFSDWKARILLPIADITGLKYLIPDLPKAFDDVAIEGGRTHVCYDRDSVMASASILKMMKLVKGELSSIETPLLVMQSSLDTVVAKKSAGIIYEGISSRVKEKMILKKSYHTITVDVEKELVAKNILDFFEGQL